MRKFLTLSLIALCGAQAIVDQAEKDVTVYVIVPQEIPLTVKSGHSFRDSALEFCNKNGLDISVFHLKF